MSQDDKGKHSKVSLIRLCADAGKKGIDSAYDRSRFMGVMAGELVKEGAKAEALAVARDAVREANKVEGLLRKAEALHLVASYQEQAGDASTADDTRKMSKKLLTELAAKDFSGYDSGGGDADGRDDADGKDRGGAAVAAVALGGKLLGAGNAFLSLLGERLRWPSARPKKADKKKRADDARDDAPKPPTEKPEVLSAADFAKIMLAHSRKTNECRALIRIANTLYKEGCKKEARKVLHKSYRAASQDAERSVRNLADPVMAAVMMAEYGLERESRAAFAETVARVKRFWHEGSLFRSLAALGVRDMILEVIAKEQIGVGHVADAVETLRGVRIPRDSVKQPDPAEIVEAFARDDKLDYAFCYMRGIEDDCERARAWCRMARVYADKDDKRVVRAMLQEARKALAEATGDTSKIYSDIIKLYNRIYDFDTALEIAKGVPDKQLRARTLASMADAMAKLKGDDKNANEIFAMAVDSTAGIEDGFYRAMHLYWIALEQAASGHTGNAWDDNAGIFATVLRIAGRKAGTPDKGVRRQRRQKRHIR